MKAKIKTIVYNPLFSGSIVMILGSNLANMFSYFYHVVLGRMLGPVDYGSLSAFLNLVTLFGSTYSFLGLVIVKYASSAKESEISGLLKWFYKRGLMFGILGMFLIILFSGVISGFLNVERNLVIFVGLIFLIAMLSFIIKSFMQGLLEFSKLAISVNIEIVARLILGVLFVAWGYSLMGVVWGFALASLLGFSVMYVFIRKHKNNEVVEVRPSKLASYAIPVFIFSISNLSIISTDVLLAKHFLSSYEAGIYASLSTLGKIVFFGTSPVSSVMFPVVSRRQAEGKNYLSVLLLSILMTSGICLFVLSLYILVPELMVRILFGQKYLEAAKYLGLFGWFASIFAISSLIISYYLSKNKTVVSYIMFSAALLQFCGIWLFHDSLDVIIKVSIFSVFSMLIAIIIFMYYEVRNEIKK